MRGNSSISLINKLNPCSGEFSLVKRVVEGELTLEQHLIGCKERYEKELFRFRVNNDELANCVKEIKVVASIANHFGYYPSVVPEIKDYKRDKVDMLLLGNMGWIVSNFSSLLIGSFPAFPPLSILGGALAVGGLTWQTLCYSSAFSGKTPIKKKKLRQDLDCTFGRLNDYVCSVDQMIHKDYIIDYYKKAANEERLVKYETRAAHLFKLTFEKMEDCNKREVLLELFKLDETRYLFSFLAEVCC